MTHQGLNLNKIEARGRFNTVMFIDLLENLQQACYCNRHENLQLDLPSADSIFNIFTLVNLFFSLIR
jgi:hypothetical protein